MTVSSGIETKNFQQAHDEILHQLELVKQGVWEDWELQGALATMCSSLTSLSDSQGALENYYLGQIATDAGETPEELAIAILAQILLVKNRGRQALTDAKEDKA